jgi:hypothetical protein
MGVITAIVSSALAANAAFIRGVDKADLKFAPKYVHQE